MKKGKNENYFETTRKKNELVYIVDSLGLQQAFFSLKSILSIEQANFLSILYFSNDTSEYPLFKRELEYLEKRFQSRLSVLCIKVSNKLTIDKGTIEVVINCSVVENQNFIIIGEQEFINTVEDELLFLNINEINIEKKII